MNKIMLVAALCVLPAGTALAADEDIVGLWANGVVWGSAYESALDRTGELNSNAYGINNTNERTGYAGRYTSGERFVIAEQDPGTNDRAEGAYPQYKPEYWDDLLMYNYLHKSDPTKQYIEAVWKNLPMGLPMMGAPDMIAQGPRDNELLFIYQRGNTWKYVPTDCREHDEGLSYDAGYLGHGVGCWDGNTLTVVSKGFSTDTWIRDFGMIHSPDMVVTETFTLNEDSSEIEYVSMVEDPMLLEPFQAQVDNLGRQDDPLRFLAEDYPYVETNQLEIGGGC